MRSVRPLSFLMIALLTLGLSGSRSARPASRPCRARRPSRSEPVSRGPFARQRRRHELHDAVARERALQTNLYFLHRCQITPGGGVGHHFHNTTEEMFVIFDGEAEFTVDGRTSLLKGTVGAPVRMGHSHAIYNPGKTPVEFMNINVSAVKGKYDAFDLNDARVGAPKDEKPVFMTMRLDKNLLRPADRFRGGAGTAMYRRALDPSVFLTNWSYVDHLVLPPGASEGMHRHTGVEEVYYVINGDGEASVAGETTADSQRRRGAAAAERSARVPEYRQGRSRIHDPGHCGAEGRARRAGNGAAPNRGTGAR